MGNEINPTPSKHDFFYAILNTGVLKAKETDINNIIDENDDTYKSYIGASINAFIKLCNFLNVERPDKKISIDLFLKRYKTTNSYNLTNLFSTFFNYEMYLSRSYHDESTDKFKEQIKSTKLDYDIGQDAPEIAIWSLNSMLKSLKESTNNESLEKSNKLNIKTYNNYKKFDLTQRPSDTMLKYLKAKNIKISDKKLKIPDKATIINKLQLDITSKVKLIEGRIDNAQDKYNLIEELSEKIIKFDDQNFTNMANYPNEDVSILCKERSSWRSSSYGRTKSRSKMLDFYKKNMLALIKSLDEDQINEIKANKSFDCISNALGIHRDRIGCFSGKGRTRSLDQFDLLFSQSENKNNDIKANKSI